MEHLKRELNKFNILYLIKSAWYDQHTSPNVQSVFPLERKKVKRGVTTAETSIKPPKISTMID